MKGQDTRKEIVDLPFLEIFKTQLLDLLLVNSKGLVGDVTVRDCLWLNDHGIGKFLILGEVRN